MAVELDHVFVLTRPGAPEADRLVELGLAEGEPNTHPGQGTANSRFFFHNAMLEFLWVHDEVEAARPPASGTRLLERWRGRGTGACPFGICLRPSGHGAAELPFPAWEYRPPYLPDGLAIHVAKNAELIDQPFLFYMPFLKPPTASAAPQPMEHALGFREVTACRVHGPGCADGREPMASVARAGAVRFVRDDEHLLVIGFDGEGRGKSMDFRPDLPLVFHW